MTALYPWQQDVWHDLVRRQHGSGLPHALLLSGGDGIGKHELALHLGRWLLCQQAAAQSLTEACGQCHSCQLWQAGSHPDFMLCQPEDSSRQIRIDGVRRVNEFLAQTPQISHCQVVVVRPVEVMNINAANALLKTLEEPAGESYLILETERFGSVLPTIRSRCQRLVLQTPPQPQALQWLQQQGVAADTAVQALRLCHGAPLAAQQWLTQNTAAAQQQWLLQLRQWSLGEVPLQAVSEAWGKLELSDVTSWFYTVLSDCIKAALGVPPAQQLLGGEVQQLCDCATLDRAKLLTLQAEIQSVLGHLLSGMGNYNKQLLCESLLLQWQDLLRGPAA